MRLILSTQFGIAALLLLASLAAAGSPQNPNMTDPPGDVQFMANVLLPAQPPHGLADTIDLLAAWVNDTPTDLQFGMKTVNLANLSYVDGNPDAQMDFHFSFKLGGDDMDADPWYSQHKWNCDFQDYTIRKLAVNVQCGADLNRSTVWMRVPKRIVQGADSGANLTAPAGWTVQAEMGDYALSLAGPTGWFDGIQAPSFHYAIGSGWMPHPSSATSASSAPIKQSPALAAPAALACLAALAGRKRTSSSRLPKNPGT